ncbi:beta-galactosidase-1-like protein 2 isoform X1 [Synchiropus splendidus]|uniref:beta-galactosidase-1-like protein 2 isoform X1 n=2 Tax=Synchiropus splendidus TaxID=270530 RepID=UPI00237E1C67|nr:beta-galactosidase-1-like protein 2 isoform X1 [Synchiropus splendidus]XP_053729846.1 beta-galactosidase-1-like protein 2 isoform X1 [Synchiropus splendidus]XP_053729847.1 beta-galactosidase-1-like protein 2 isoform X1 [Synchiropus splendidus]
MHKRRYLWLLCVALGAIIVYQFTRKPPQARRMQRTEGLKADASQFSLEGEPFRILGGSIHYFRVPRAYWEDRLLKMKACGLNTLTTYVPWNLHEPERGVFNFEDELDLVAYLQLASRLGLWVILRPGPYICAEWDLGGLPSWLLRDKNMKLRTTYPGFTDAVDSYFNQLIKTVVPFQYSKGGPIIAVQVENEYGDYAKDEDYMAFIKEALLSRGITELLLTSDDKDGLKPGRVNGALETLNFQKLDLGDIKYLEELHPQKPKMVTEYWTGWFDLWGDLHHVYPAEDMVEVVKQILKLGMSINLYMFHGGTNFGFMNGAYAIDLPAPKPMVTSYDYDAPLSEAGDYTTKYHLLRDLFTQYHTKPLPEPPSLQERRAYQPVVIQQHLSLWDTLHFTDKPTKSETPVNMENLPVNHNNGQSYGYTLYQTLITSGGRLHSRNSVRDRALVFVDRLFIGVLDYKTQELPIPDAKEERALRLLVENWGRVNFGETLDEQRKGLVGDVELNKRPLRDFVIYSLEMKPDFIHRLVASGQWRQQQQQPPPPPPPSYPSFFLGRLHVDETPQDTFIKLPGWSKGVVFINGRNLGRYWSVGPQQTLYLPAPWLHSGDNQVMVLEEQESDGKIQFTSSPDYGSTVAVQ